MIQFDRNFPTTSINKMADKEMIEEKIGEAIGLEKAGQNAVTVNERQLKV